MPILVQPNTRTIAQYSSVAATTSQITESAVIIEPAGDITGLDFQLSVAAAGTLSTPSSRLAMIKRVTITDRSGAPILDVLGTDLMKLYLWMNPSGAYTSPSTVTGGGTTDTLNFVLPLPISLKEQPAKLQVILAPYSDLATSGATGATYNLAINGWYGSVPQTLRVYKRTIAIAAGDNSLGIQLVDNKNTQAIGIALTASNTNYLTFSSDGKIDNLSKITLQQLADMETMLYMNGHQTNIYNLFVAPFVSRISNTKFSINAVTTDSVDIFQIATN